MVVVCKRVKYHFSPPTSRALPFETESLNPFSEHPEVVRRGISTYLPTYLPTYQPYSAFLRAFFIFHFLRLFRKTTGVVNGGFLTFCDMSKRGKKDGEIKYHYGSLSSENSKDLERKGGEKR